MQSTSQQHSIYQQQHQAHLQQQQQQQLHQQQLQHQHQLQFFQQQQHHQQLMQDQQQQQMQLQLQMHFPSPSRTYPVYPDENTQFESFSPASGPGSAAHQVSWGGALSPQTSMHTSSLIGSSPGDNRLQMPGPFPDSGHDTLSGAAGQMMSPPHGSSGNNTLYSYLPSHVPGGGSTSLLSNHLQPTVPYGTSGAHSATEALGDVNNDNLYDIRLNAGYDFGGPMTNAWNNMGTLS